MEMVRAKDVKGVRINTPYGRTIKALVGGMSLTLAMDEGLMDPDDQVCRYVPQ